MRICVFCSSSDAVDRAFLDAAAQTGSLIAQGGHSLVFGGGRVGLMGAVARGVHAGGGRVVGIIPTFMNRPGVPCLDCDELIFTADMRERKARMMEMAEAFIALPGGFGTLEEMSEVITQKQFDFVTYALLRAPAGTTPYPLLRWRVFPDVRIPGSAEVPDARQVEGDP